MSTPAWYSGFLAAFGPARRYESLFSMSDRQLAQRGFDREALQKTYVASLGAY